MRENPAVHGSLFRAFLNAGESLKLLLDGYVDHLESYRENAWYSLDEFNELLGLAKRYSNSGKILEQIGIEMMNAWYQHGPGQSMISTSLGFLKFQSSSAGFLSVVAGSRDIVGAFVLEELDEAKGMARVHSTTIFPRELERGILMGGLGLIGDLLYFTVDNNRNADDFDILFVDQHNRHTITWQSGLVSEEIEWRFRHHINITREKNQFWACINDTLNAAYAEMLMLATIDPLTAIYNRREFLRLADIELGKSRRNNYPLSLLYLDIDHFKSINDTYGHEAGDKALQEFAKLCKRECREYDVIGRLGGEEFCILLPLTAEDAALVLAERMLATTRDMVVKLPQTALSITISIGIAAHDGKSEIHELIRRADKALFHAKQSGRDRIAKADKP